MTTIHPHAPWCQSGCKITSGSREEVLEGQLAHFIRAHDDCVRLHYSDMAIRSICTPYDWTPCNKDGSPNPKPHKYIVSAGEAPREGQKCCCGEDKI